tara:strand:+ start:1740 stop:2042 length:303 start_codon:yes stop_codon:yes gene_type:complete
MPLKKGDEVIITAHASKQSKMSFKFFEAHTSALVPLFLIPVFPFLITIKIAGAAILVLILLERRGWTIPIALKKTRSRLAGRYRYRKGRMSLIRRSKGLR